MTVWMSSYPARRNAKAKPDHPATPPPSQVLLIDISPYHLTYLYSLFLKISTRSCASRGTTTTASVLSSFSRRTVSRRLISAVASVDQPCQTGLTIANTQAHGLTREPCRLQQVQLVLQQRAVGEWQQRFGHVQREGIEQLGVHVGEDDGLCVYVCVCLCMNVCVNGAGVGVDGMTCSAHTPSPVTDHKRNRTVNWGRHPRVVATDGAAELLILLQFGLVPVCLCACGAHERSERAWSEALVANWVGCMRSINWLF